MAFPRSVFTLLRSATLLSTFLALVPAGGQGEHHERGYKAPPPTATVKVTVEKATSGKPLPNASVIFRAVRNDEEPSNLEMKTDPDGNASLDLLEVGSHVTVQVIAYGYATYASSFDLLSGGKEVLIKMQRPRAQISVYGESVDRPAEVAPGVQERPQSPGKSPAPVAPAAATPVAPAAAPAIPTTPKNTLPAPAPETSAPPSSPSPQGTPPPPQGSIR